MAPDLVTLEEILKMFAGKHGLRTVEVAEEEYVLLLTDAQQAGLVLLESENEFSVRSDGATIRIQRSLGDHLEENSNSL
jgi:hypothetical protein